jgi:hypothetical protein
MARPGRTESESVPIWLKLSEADAEQMDQVLARPEFAGWTKAEWCLEIIQTALRYYTKRPVAEPGRARAPARPAVTESPPPEPEPGFAAPETEAAAPQPESAAPQPKRAARKRRPAAPEPSRAAPGRRPAAAETERAAAETGRAMPGPERVAPETGRAAPGRERVEPEPTRADPGPEPGAEPEPVAPEPTDADSESPLEVECPHPADARDYQTGTCAACGAILWD